MSRLLHAAARGARIEALDKNLGWILSSHCPLALSNDTRPYRIHPDDAHLAYGPVSTALRDDALEDGENVRRVWYDAFIAEYLTVDDKDVVHSFLDTRTFLLILAEFLADEGM